MMGAGLSVKTSGDKAIVYAWLFGFWQAPPCRYGTAA